MIPRRLSKEERSLSETSRSIGIVTTEISTSHIVLSCIDSFIQLSQFSRSPGDLNIKNWKIYLRIIFLMPVLLPGKSHGRRSLVGLRSMGSLRVQHDWATSFSLSTFMYWRRKWQPTPVFLPGESQGRGAWWAAVYGVEQSWTRLKGLSSSSSRIK